MRGFVLGVNICCPGSKQALSLPKGSGPFMCCAQYRFRHQPNGMLCMLGTKRAGSPSVAVPRLRAMLVHAYH